MPKLYKPMKHARLVSWRNNIKRGGKTCYWQWYVTICEEITCAKQLLTDSTTRLVYRAEPKQKIKKNQQEKPISTGNPVPVLVHRGSPEGARVYGGKNRQHKRNTDEQNSVYTISRPNLVYLLHVPFRTFNNIRKQICMEPVAWNFHIMSLIISEQYNKTKSGLI